MQPIQMTASECCLEDSRETNFWTGTWLAIGRLYCRSFHRTISRPVNGKYTCWRCLREYELEW